MGNWFVERSALTPDQLRAVELDPREHRLVFGGPGSGKTVVLLHRARYLADRDRVPPERFHIFVFTNVLTQYIRSALALLKLPEDCVSTFDAWCCNYHEAHISRCLPWDPERKTRNFPEIRAAVLEHLRAQGQAAVRFDFVLVDEGQDLTSQAFEILKIVARHVTMFMDHKQQIYEGGADEAAILRGLGLRRRHLSLLETYRCSPYIVALAAGLVTDPAGRAAFLQQPRVPQIERQMPLLYLARDFDDEKARLINVIRNRQLQGDRIAILFPRKDQVFGFANGLRESGLEVEVPEQRGRQQQFPTLDFASDRPKLMPYPSAKGLTFDTVIMPRLVPKSFGSTPPERIEKLLFVGITRATRWVYFSTVGEGQLAVFARLREVAAQGHLHIQSGATAESSAAPTDEAQDQGSDTLSDWF